MTQMRDRMSHKLTKDRVRLEIRRAKRPFLVLLGMIVVAILALSYLGGNLRSSFPWQSPYRVKIAIDDAKGVFPGKQEVRISGVSVGQISGLQLVDGHPVLEATIDSQYAPLYHDAVVALRPRTPLDDLFLDVENRGHPSAGKLQSGQTLTAARTQTPVDIGRVADLFDADTRLRVKQAINELGVALGDHGLQLRQTLVELAPFLSAAQRLTAQLAIRHARTRRLVHNFRLMTEELARRDSQLTGLVSAGASTLTELADQSAPLNATLAELPPTLRRLQSSFAAVRAAADDLDPALDSLQPTAEALPSGLAALRRLTTDALPAVTALQQPVRHLAPFLGYLRPTATRLRSAFRALSPQTPRLDRITAKIVPCEHALDKFFNNTISVTKFATPRYAFPRGQLIFGASLLGGVINDPAQKAYPSCAPGGPQK